MIFWLQCLISLTVWFYVGWSWVRWARHRVAASGPRSLIALLGFAVLSFSIAIEGFMTIHAWVTGGYPYYHPVELFSIRIGFWTAFVGFVAAIVGKGILRLPGVVVSSFLLCVWVLAGLAQ